jgi:hypothetical protein
VSPTLRRGCVAVSLKGGSLRPLYATPLVQQQHPPHRHWAAALQKVGRVKKAGSHAFREKGKGKAASQPATTLPQQSKARTSLRTPTALLFLAPAVQTKEGRGGGSTFPLPPPPEINSSSHTIHPEAIQLFAPSLPQTGYMSVCVSLPRSFFLFYFRPPPAPFIQISSQSNHVQTDFVQFNSGCCRGRPRRELIDREEEEEHRNSLAPAAAVLG